MSQTLTSADVSHYHQRLADLSTLPFWQLPDLTEPTGPERGHVWHYRDIYRNSRDSGSSPAMRPPCSSAAR